MTPRKLWKRFQWWTCNNGHGYWPKGHIPGSEESNGQYRARCRVCGSVDFYSVWDR